MRNKVVLEQIQAIRADVFTIKVDMCEVKGRIGLVEAQHSGLHERVDRLTGDVEQIKRRLEMVPVF